MNPSLATTPWLLLFNARVLSFVFLLCFSFVWYWKLNYTEPRIGRLAGFQPVKI